VIEIGSSVEIKEPQGSGKWDWTGKTGLVTTVDDHCFSVRRDDTGKVERDVREHYREVRPR